MTYLPPSIAETGSTGIAELRDRHKGQTAYLVGKGPSLAHVRASDIGPGPVIVLNEAIGIIQLLGLPNHVYAMQKDGCNVRDENGARPCSSCAGHGWQRDGLINPYPGIATIFSEYLSGRCLLGRGNRFVFTDAELGYPDLPYTMSVLEAIPFARHLGVDAIVMVAFDSLTNGDLGYPFDYEPDALPTLRANLEWVRPQVLAALDGFPHSFFTPAAHA